MPLENLIINLNIFRAILRNSSLSITVITDSIGLIRD